MADSNDANQVPPVDHVRRGRLLRHYRRKAEVSLREFARQAQVNHSIVSRVEQGSQHASPRLIEAYRDIVGVEVRGSEVLPSIMHFDLDIEIVIYRDDWMTLRIVWRGKTERYRMNPDLVVDLSGWPTQHHFTDAFGRSVVATPVEMETPASAYQKLRPALLKVPDNWVDSFAEYEEAWTMKPPPGLTAFRFALPRGGVADNARLKFFLYSFNRTILWFDDELVARPNHRRTVIELGPLEPSIWHKISWGRLNNHDFGRQDFMYGMPLERERAAARKGWIQVGEDLWENEDGVQKRLDEIT